MGVDPEVLRAKLLRLKEEKSKSKSRGSSSVRALAPKGASLSSQTSGTTGSVGRVANRHPVVPTFSADAPEKQATAKVKPITPHLLLSYLECVLDIDLRAFGFDHEKTRADRAEYELALKATRDAGAATCSKCGFGANRPRADRCERCDNVGLCSQCGRCAIGHCAPERIGHETEALDRERIARDGDGASLIGPRPAPCSFCQGSGEPCACNDGKPGKPQEQPKAPVPKPSKRVSLTPLPRRPPIVPRKY